jgi:hypothetical protein
MEKGERAVEGDLRDSVLRKRQILHQYVQAFVFFV